MAGWNSAVRSAQDRLASGFGTVTSARQTRTTRTGPPSAYLNFPPAHPELRI